MQSSDFVPLPAAQRSVDARAWVPPRRLGGVTWDGPPEPVRRPVRTSRQVRDGWCRFLNIAAASLFLLLFSPLMILIALAVRLTSRGPIIYRQRRVGIDRRRGRGARIPEDRRDRDRGGRMFDVYKFRTMYHDGSDQQVWASDNDPRVTPVGRLLRAYRLDELPQLVNVIKGDMNVVGPRPEQPEIFQELRGEVEGYSERQRVLPGITGWAQIHHHYDRSVDDVKTKLQYDLEYIRNRSPLHDLRIMTRTPAVMVFKQGSR